TLGLVVLLCLSPCKVRNYIQSEFGALQTEVSNKSQTTINTANCNVFDVADAALNAAKPSIKHLAALVANNTDFTLNAIDFNNKPTITYNTKSESVSFVPFYILFQNFKVYL